MKTDLGIPRVIDNKKILLTADEWTMYQNIIKSYTTLTNDGKTYFQDLFEVNSDGIIIFLKPPTKKHTSFEIFLFLMSVMQNQHLRGMWAQVDDICDQMKNKMKEIENKI